MPWGEFFKNVFFAGIAILIFMLLLKCAAKGEAIKEHECHAFSNAFQLPEQRSVAFNVCMNR